MAVVLSVGAVFSYELSLFLDAAVKRLCARGGMLIAASANSIPVVNNPDEETSDILLQFMHIVSNLLFLIVVMIALAWIGPILLLRLSLAIIGSFVFLMLTAAPAAEAEPDRDEVAASSRF